MFNSRASDPLDNAVRISLPVGALGSAIALAWGAKAALGVAGGAALGIAGLWLLQRIVPRVCAAKRPRLWMRALWIAKFPLLCTLLYFLIGKELVSAGAFCFGVGVVPAVLVAVTLWPERKPA